MMLQERAVLEDFEAAALVALEDFRLMVLPSSLVEETSVIFLAIFWEDFLEVNQTDLAKEMILNW